MKQIKSLFRRAKAHKISDVAMAKESGRDTSTFQLWKTGKSSPNMGTFQSVEDALERLIAKKVADEASNATTPTEAPNQTTQAK